LLEGDERHLGFKKDKRPAQNRPNARWVKERGEGDHAVDG